jgi:hypothetical protein
MIDEHSAYHNILNGTLSFYDFQKWVAEQKKDVPEDIGDAIYDKGYADGRYDAWEDVYGET